MELVNLYARCEDGKWRKIFENIPEDQARSIWQAGFATGHNYFSIETAEGRRIQEMNALKLGKPVTFNIEVYDKDNDVYKKMNEAKDLNLAITLASAYNDACKQESLLNGKEPFDWAVISVAGDTIWAAGDFVKEGPAVMDKKLFESFKKRLSVKDSTIERSKRHAY